MAPQNWSFSFMNSAVSTPVSLEGENEGSLDQGEQIRWQFDVPESGSLFNLQVDQGTIIFYASTETTAPSEAFYQWKIETSSSRSVFIKPVQIRRNKRSASINETLIPVFTTLLGQAGMNTFTLTSGKPGLFKSIFFYISYTLTICSQVLEGQKAVRFFWYLLLLL